MRRADENRGHHWIITKKSADLYREWRVDQWKRDADAMDVLAYTDYSGYGTGEVVENMVRHPKCYCSRQFANDGSYAHSTQ